MAKHYQAQKSSSPPRKLKVKLAWWQWALFIVLCGVPAGWIGWVCAGHAMK